MNRILAGVAATAILLAANNGLDAQATVAPPDTTVVDTAPPPTTAAATTTTRPPATTTTAVKAPKPPTVAGLLPAPRRSTWPRWRTTAAGVPYYAGRPACTAAQANVIARRFIADGADLPTARWAIYVASREGGCRATAHHVGRRDDSHCAFQLNARRPGPLSRRGYLTALGWTPTAVRSSLDACADAASDLWRRCGKGPWVAGDYRCRRPRLATGAKP